jgi:hypothetical protein
VPYAAKFSRWTSAKRTVSDTPLSVPNVLTNDVLRAILAPRFDTAPCACNFHSCQSWESVPDSEWSPANLTHVASLRDGSIDEPTFEEFHLNGSRYDSAAAPISVRHFPYNRSDLWRCKRCLRFALRYTEFGGYYVDHRVRLARPELVAR